jgi:predicted peptidase
MKKLLQLLLPLILFAGCAPEELPEANYLKEKVTYSSKNIIGFENLFGEALDTQEDLDIFGIMHFPDNYDSSKKYPVIVASHGSLNWRAHHLDYLEQMRQANYIEIGRAHV